MKNKRVGIVTMYHGNNNYGACLQAYALTMVIKNMGFICEQISFTSRNNESIGLKKKIEESLKKYGLFKTVKIVYDAIFYKFKDKLDRISGVKEKIETREVAMKAFREQMIPHSKNIYSNQDINKCEGYDAYVCGSDQVWRVGWGYLNPGFWLTFVHDGGRKISYAASIAMNEIPVEEHKMIRNALSDFKFISVRESQGKKLLDEILKQEKKVEWVVDPTLLLNQFEWNSITGNNRYKDEKYIFAYLLGDKIEDRQEIEKYAKNKGLKIITIPYLLGVYRACDKEFGDIQLSNVDPQLFLSLIRDAEYVITDSFHGIVFSLLFHSKFWCLKRSSDSSKDSMNSRVYSLLELCKSNKRIIDSKELNFTYLNENINFNNIDLIIEEERKRCKILLYGALNED